MLIKVLFFARLREAFGHASESIDVEPGTTVDDLMTTLAARGEPWQSELRSGRVIRAAVNQDMVPFDRVLQEGDEVALFPPVTGG